MAEMDGCAVVGTPTMCFSYCCSGGPMKQSCKKEFGRIDCSGNHSKRSRFKAYRAIKS